MRGLQVLSGLMAAFSGLAAAIVGAMVIGFFASLTVGVVRDQPVAWSTAAKGVSASGDFSVRRTCATAGESDCAKPSAWVVAPLVAGMAAALLPMAALAYGLSQACLCFVGMARARFLERRTASRLAHFAAGGLLFVLASPFSDGLARGAVGLTHRVIDLVTGQNTAMLVSSFGVSLSGVSGPLTALYAVTLTVIAGVLVKASRIADDHAQII